MTITVSEYKPSETKKDNKKRRKTPAMKYADAQRDLRRNVCASFSEIGFKHVFTETASEVRFTQVIGHGLKDLVFKTYDEAKAWLETAGAWRTARR